MSPFIEVWLVFSYILGLIPIVYFWIFLKDKTAARLTLLHPFAPITFPLFAITLILYGIYFVIRTAIGKSEGEK